MLEASSNFLHDVRAYIPIVDGPLYPVTAAPHGF